MKPIAIIFVALCFAAIAPVDAHATEPLPVVIVAGQSNAYRLGSLAQHKKGKPIGAKVYYYANPQCTKAGAINGAVKTFAPNTPLHGMGIGIARELAKRYPDGFALVRYAICGSNLHTQWKPADRDGYYHKHFEPFLARGLAQIKKASGRDVVVTGVLWHQGESNAQTSETVAAHGKLMPILIEKFRKTCGPVPFVMGEIREFDDRPTRKAINTGMHKIAAADPRVAAVRLSDVAWLPEGNVHLSQKGAEVAGSRMVLAWVELERDRKK